MSKDPLEELFGLLDDANEAETEAIQPVSARARLSQEQSVRTHERQPDIPRTDQPAKQKRRAKRGAASLIAQAQTEAATAAIPAPEAAPTTPIARTTAMPTAASTVPAPAPAVPASEAAPTAPLVTPTVAARQAPRPAAAPRVAAAPAVPTPGYARNGGNAGGVSAMVIDDEPQDARARFMPWVVVGVVALVAIIGATFLIGGIRGGGNEATPAPVEKVEPVAPKPSPSTTDTDKTKEEVVEEPKDDVAPTVEVGATYPIPVPQWDATFDLSDRLGSSCGYNIEGDNLVMCTDLVESFPESCSALRTGWGITKTAEGKFELLRPEGTCEESKALYDNVWGLMQAAADSMKAA